MKSAKYGVPYVIFSSSWLLRLIFSQHLFSYTLSIFSYVSVKGCKLHIHKNGKTVIFYILIV